jgi:TrpR-related protein YerC/YecD
MHFSLVKWIVRVPLEIQLTGKYVKHYQYKISNGMQEKDKKIDWDIKENKQLVEAFLSLKNQGEMERFLRDLMTEGEIREFASRLEAARLLSRDMQYKGIIEKTGLSSTTIARIAKWLKGPEGGYRLTLARICNHHRNSS